MSGFKALVLAGSRGGDDPVATYAGVPHKALITLEGRTLLARVVDSLRGAGAGTIAVMSSHPAVRALGETLGVAMLEEAAGPSLSVHAGAANLGAPLLVTTADHALLKSEWVRQFLTNVPPQADVAALVADRATVEAAAPGTQRTWLKLADGQWSGCNLFYLATPRALNVLELWRRVEAERKRPWRMARILGTGMLIRYACGRLSLAEAGRRLGELAGVDARIVTTPFGAAAIDVDKPSDLDLVRRMTANHQA